MKTILLIILIFCQLPDQSEIGKKQSNHLKKEVTMNLAKQNRVNGRETGRKVLIDKFFIPKEAKTEFVTRMKLNRDFIKNVPGFAGDHVYEQTDENGDFILVTVATWQSDEALKNAKEAVQREYQRINFNPPEMLNRLHIRMERDIYSELEY
jgi:heme-degrading monooxygenase HmoA